MFRSTPFRLAIFLFLVVVSGLPAAAAKQRVPGEIWERYATPDEAGFSAEKLEQARQYWESIGSSAVLVVYRGAVVAEWGETARRFRCHSVRKSFMSGMYGLYIESGKIDKTKTMLELGIDDEPKLTETERQATIQDLLGARSGVYRPAAYEPPQNSKPERGSHAPGTNWVYNNWDFNTLVTILEQQAGIGFFEEFGRRFAEPIGMQDYDPSHGYYHYEREKSIHPAYPFRMSARDMARYGLLYLNRGSWGGRRILPESYIDESTAWISDTPSGGYGYMWWLEGAEPFKALGMYSALGVGGQSIDVIPGAEMVFVNRADTYLDGGVSRDERTRLIGMVLDARVGEPARKPRLEPIADPEPAYLPRALTARQAKPYVGDHPIGDSDELVEIFLENDRLFIEFGEGPLAFHNVGDDHFIIEDHDEHVYYEDREDGSKQVIVAALLLLDGRLHLDAGRNDEAIALFEKTSRYFPEDPRAHRSTAQAHVRTANGAIRLAIESYRSVAALRPDETLDKSRLAWELLTVQGDIAPPGLSDGNLQRLAGSYGERQVVFDGGKLYYSRNGRPRVALVPLTESTFQHAEIDWFRLRFDTDGNGRVFRVTGIYRDGDRDESLRDP